MIQYKEYKGINFQKELEKELAAIEKSGKVPTLLLHSCCAPCSSYCLTYLSAYFEVTVDYYNPNIYPPEEYRMRVAEQERLIEALNKEYAGICEERISELSVTEQVTGKRYPIHFREGAYEPEVFFEMARGLEQVKEGCERCFRCYELRLREAARCAKEGGFDYFTTTLSISPLKNSAKLNEIGAVLADEYDVAYLFSDFKKKNGYQRSVELSREYGLYRQDYCGCVFSKAESEKRGRAREAGMKESP